MNIKWVSGPSEIENMKGWSIFCFDCKKNVASKSLVKKNHTGHDVDWVRPDGCRYMHVGYTGIGII